MLKTATKIARSKRRGLSNVNTVVSCIMATATWRLLKQFHIVVVTTIYGSVCSMRDRSATNQQQSSDGSARWSLIFIYFIYYLAALVETWHDDASSPQLIACAPPGYKYVDIARPRIDVTSTSTHTRPADHPRRSQRRRASRRSVAVVRSFVCRRRLPLSAAVVSDPNHASSGA